MWSLALFDSGLMCISREYPLPTLQVLWRGIFVDAAVGEALPLTVPSQASSMDTLSHLMRRMGDCGLYSCHHGLPPLLLVLPRYPFSLSLSLSVLSVAGYGGAGRDAAFYNSQRGQYFLPKYHVGQKFSVKRFGS